MSIYLIYIIGTINLLLLLKYLIEGIRYKSKKKNKQTVSEKLMKLLKE